MKRKVTRTGRPRVFDQEKLIKFTDDQVRGLTRRAKTAGVSLSEQVRQDVERANKPSKEG